MLSEEEFNNLYAEEIKFINFLKAFDDYTKVKDKLPKSFTHFKNYQDYKTYMEKQEEDAFSKSVRKTGIKRDTSLEKQLSNDIIQQPK